MKNSHPCTYIYVHNVYIYVYAWVWGQHACVLHSCIYVYYTYTHAYNTHAYHSMQSMSINSCNTNITRRPCFYAVQYWRMSKSILLFVKWNRDTFVNLLLENWHISKQTRYQLMIAILVNCHISKQTKLSRHYNIIPKNRTNQGITTLLG